MTSDRFNLRGFTFWQRFLRFIILIAIIVIAWEDIKNTYAGLHNYFLFRMPIPDVSGDSALRLFIGLLGLLFIYAIFILWFVHFVLPITSPNQIIPAFLRMFKFGITMGRWHGPAVFVRDGIVDGSHEEFSKNSAGVAFLDLRSAMALDKVREKVDEEFVEDVAKPQKVRFSFRKVKPYPAHVRVVGPGLAFIEKNEKITGSVDLRVQSRSRKDVIADTRDGIRVKTSVSASFTLGEPPEILDVCLVNNQVHVIEWKKDPPAGMKIVRKLSQDLHEGDADEIRNFLRNHPSPLSVTSQVPEKKFPYSFNAERVKQAIYMITHLHEPNPTPMKRWHEWPQDVAAEKFRILLSHETFMNLYAPDDSSANPMGDLRKKLGLAVRNTGVLAYRVVHRENGEDLKPGDILLERDLVFLPPQMLARPDVLRDRGIKVLNAGCGDLEPIDKDVREKFKDSWLAIKRKEEMLKRADYELEATRIRNHARVRTQQSMNYHLAKLLEKQEYPREALAILIFQELEAAAADPETRKLLPDNTLNLMQSISQMLMQNPKDESGDAKPLPEDSST